MTVTKPTEGELIEMEQRAEACEAVIARVVAISWRRDEDTIDAASIAFERVRQDLRSLIDFVRRQA